MCGIVGYMGKEDCIPQLLHALKIVEYRGYDSAGISCLDHGKLITIKTKGKIAKLETLLQHHPYHATIGIGHTRWATHGKPSTRNAHPHTYGHWSIVHNGIIENAHILKQECPEPFSSQTDSEVIAHLLEKNNHLRGIDCFRKVISQLQGTYAIAGLHEGEESMYVAKYKNPLYIAQNNESIMISSDLAVFYGKFYSYYCLKDHEIAMIQENSITFYNQQGKSIAKQSLTLQNVPQTISKGIYPYYMEKEIHEIPYVTQSTWQQFVEDESLLHNIPWQNYTCIHFIACGTAYHAGQMGAIYFEKYAHIPCKSSIASEFLYENTLFFPKTLYILISQSGETADTLSCCEKIKSHQCDTLAIVNVPHSRLSQIATYVLHTLCGPEMSVASTKVYTAQLTLLYLLATHVHIGQSIPIEQVQSILAFTDSITPIPSSFLPKIVSYKKILFVGKGEDYITAKEASLKFKEITYTHCLALPCGELKHGSLALIDADSLVIVICTKPNMIDKINTCMEEIKARNGHIWLVTNENKKKFAPFDTILSYPNWSTPLSAVTSIIPLQLLAYQTAVAKGLNPDQPRNLAKSVTVE